MAVERQLPPNNLEAEEALLGALLVDPDAIHRVAATVSATDFYREANGWIYKAIHDLGSAGKPSDLLAVSDLLERRGQLKTAGGMAQLTLLINAVPTSLHADHYADLVSSYAIRRRLIEAAQRITAKAWDTNSQDPISYAHKALLSVGNGHRGGLRSIAEAAGRLYDQIEYWAANPLKYGEVRGLSTGLPSVDALTEGLLATDLVLLAARPSMGKSALAFDIARRVAAQNRSVAVFSLEMSTEKVLMRWASAMSQVNTRRVKRGICPDNFKGRQDLYVSSDELGEYLKRVDEAQQLSAYIDDEPALTASQIRARSLAAAQRLGSLALVVVDHSGLMKGERESGENSVKVEGRKSQRMKELAKELRCPVLLVQQLNRGVESRQNKRPRLNDLRDTGEHEQNADIVLALYRDSYYKEYEKGSRKDLDLEVLCLKHRDGAAGVKRVLRYERELSRFTEWEIER